MHRAIRILSVYAIVTLIVTFTYAAVQQNYRQNANDPQIQMAEDAAATLSAGGPLDRVVPTGTVEISTSLAPYLLFADPRTNVAGMIGSGRLDGKIPTIPQGVFDVARKSGENRVTWQPRPGVRQAVVVVKYDVGGIPGYVVAGRSLSEVEKRESQLSQFFILTWIGSMLLVSLAVFIRPRKPSAI